MRIVKVFFQDQGVKVPDEAWKKIRRRGFMPKRTRAETKDKKPTKQMLKKILNYADIKARSMILFLISSGARIGETLQLVKDDFDFNSDPPRVHIRAKITKGGVGERTTYFSYEAREAIQDWLNIKDGLTKRGTYGDYSGERVFSWGKSTSQFMWNMACDKAGIGTKDKRTGRRIYHIHSLRKFFRTKIGLDLDVTHALMGHTEYLDDSYLRLEEEGEIASAYLEAMPNVSVYAVQSEEVKDIEKENQELKERLDRLERENNAMMKRFDAALEKLSEIEKLVKAS